MGRQFGKPVRQTDNARILFLLSVSFMVLFGALAFLFLRSDQVAAANKVSDLEEAVIETTTVLIPLKEIPSGVQLQRPMFRVEQRDLKSVEPGAIKSAEEILGHYAATTIIAGLALNKKHVTDIKPVSAISQKIPAGYRAVAINVNATTSVEGWAQPGSRVDVTWATKLRNEPAVAVIVHNAEVLSVERNPGNTQPNGQQQGTPIPSTVTLLVTSDDAQKILLATSAGAGSLSLSLRGDTDPGKADNVSTITVDDLLGTRSTTGTRPSERVTGTITMGGQKWNMTESGELVPAGKKSL